ncbi:3-alpha,7-alpha,12-alpha-trihydroxy-5-beta-cholest-24-enoyl-CoA hydratase [Pseudomonas capeferrum]|uniref:MaoC family dehydratase N-terminal domain-containing protein n=1 Tax=Pseudomonas capeferrum TaxID=1495066 RepID=UPI0015E44F38|nr:MaoC family dehydratase N-terminal domain-containing protein [Pseudomonas capeferrum]MBA1204296.1 3-alpha,7-alpha,12-alpha-trihydroxy-5-beta-cholest-24-enoyl-CoA hydratase [Pseudomonas capeferrum]
MALNYQKLMNWPFPAVVRRYSQEDCILIARGFGAGGSPDWAEPDRSFLEPGDALQVLPATAVALADGEFWQMDPRTGIAWQQIVHAQESLRMHRPLACEGELVITQKIDEVFDRGADKGAVMLQTLTLSEPTGKAVASIEVTTLLRGNGGFGGKPQDTPRPAPLPTRQADLVLDIPTPGSPDTLFRLSADIAIAAQTQGKPQAMMRGVGCFGLACRGALRLVCGNDARRLRSFTVRYAGPMYTGETMRLELWQVEPGLALLRMHAVERDQPVLSHGVIEYQD